MNTYIKIRLLLLTLFVLVLLPGRLSAQETVVMPHHGMDTLTIDRGHCYTILDPGGPSNYLNNEDSWLFITSTSGDFLLSVDYMMGANSDYNDYVRIYYTSDTNNSYSTYSGTGSTQVYSWSNGMAIHFHSNNYASFSGFEIKVLYPNTIHNRQELSATDSTMTLSWVDNLAGATGWTVTYFCDEDSLQTVTTNSTTVTLTGLRNDTWYGYYIENNATACMQTERDYFIVRNSRNDLYSGPDNDHHNLTSGVCYTVNSITGSGRNQLDVDWTQISLNTPDSVSFYADGWYRMNDGYMYYYWSGGNQMNGSMNIWGGQNQNHRVYFPLGNASFSSYRNTRYHYSLTWENNHVIRPVVTSVTATTATIQWSDTTQSTAWTLRYSCDDSHWKTLTATTTTLTLTGLTPGTQYLYTIEGNLSPSCTTPYRHAFITTGYADTLVMPYRKRDTVTLTPGNCYTLVDAGGAAHNHFHSDLSTYMLRTANQTGFKVKGWYNLPGDCRMFIYHEGAWHNYSGAGSEFEINCPEGFCTIGIYTAADERNTGFQFTILQPDTLVTLLGATGITDTSATIAWSDPLPAATSWQVHYGNEENGFTSITSTATSVELTGLMPGTQYVYYVTRTGESYACSYPERRAFITLGGDSTIILMPYRGRDTLVITPGQCYTVYDPGGEHHDYFNNDTSELIIMTDNHSDFYISGLFDYSDYYEYRSQGYDDADQLLVGLYPGNPDYMNYRCYNYYNQFDQSFFRYQSQNGFMRVRWITNGQQVRKGFHFHIDQEDQPLENVRFVHVKKNTAEVEWTDNSGYNGPWYVGYTADSVWTTVTAPQQHLTITGLQAGAKYRLRIGRTPFSEGCHLLTHSFSTLNDNDIVMTSHSRDTVWVTPGECYNIYDPGGLGDYYSSDTSILVIRSTNGHGFRIKGYPDVNDELSFYENGDYGSSYWWEVDQWCPDGIAYITLRTNEAINSSGFVFHLLFDPTLRGLDTLWMTDTAMAIVWQDTSVASQWTVTYGMSMDSLQTLTTSIPQATLSGLHRNAQCYIQIESDFSSNSCIGPSIYGIRTPHDPDIWLCQYHNRYLSSINRHSSLEQSYDYLPVGECNRILDVGGFNPPFPDNSGYHTFYSSDNRSFAVEGDYNLGSSYLYLSASSTSSNHYNIGSLNVSTQNGYIQLDHETYSRPNANGEGFDFRVKMNYGVNNVTASNLTCSSARLSWSDATGANRWWIAYGEEEGNLDTVIVTQRNYTFSGLVADRQYVCYLWSNEGSATCKAPVKHCFITACDPTTIILPYYQETQRTLNINQCYVIQDPGGPNNYHYNSHQRIHLHTNTGDPITLRGWAQIRENDYLSIYDEGSWTWYYSSWWGQDDNILIQSNTGNLCIEFNSNGDTITDPGFEFTVQFNTIGNIHTELMTDTSCRILWNDHSSANQWTLWYSSDQQHYDSITTSSRQVHLGGLVPGVTYYLFITNNAIDCIDTTWYQFCAGGDDCVDFANLYSCHTICRYGTFSSPDMYQGVIDYGPDDIYSRHTVMTDTSYRDPRTGGALRSIPEGHDHSVRLGNWNIGGEAESAAFEYVVDTAVADMMLLRYAAVLENPGHQANDQPRFQFTFTDENNNPIDTRCYAADFVSSGQLGWNLYQYDTNTVLWKDWTAVGVDLEPLHGRRIFVKLTTYDCGQTGHFGYAYFTMECDRKHIYTGACGVADTNRFTAPDGFRYRWYNVDSANVTLDTTRYFFSDQAGIYRCRASFLGDATATCFFEKTVVVGNLLPNADFSFRNIDTVGCNVTVRFQNLSSVLVDGNPSNMECDYFLWDFGGGDTSYEWHPARTMTPGYTNVHLTAFLADGLCSDDTTLRIAVPSPCLHFDTVRTAICEGDTFRLGDSAFTATGVYVVHQEFRSDSIVETLLFLTVNYVYDFSDTGEACDNETYFHNGITIPPDSLQGGSKTFHFHYTSVDGCDSLWHIMLHVWPTYDTTLSHSSCSDTGYALFNDTVYISGTYTDSLHTVTRQCDSIVHVNLTVHTAYHFYSADTICDGDSYPFHDSIFTVGDTHVVTYHTTEGCDSAFHLNLTLFPRYEFYDTIKICPRETYLFLDSFYHAPQSLMNALLTVNGCDSLFFIDLQLHDSLFRPAWQMTDDTSHWWPADSILLTPLHPYSSTLQLPDTLWEGCEPFTLYFRNRSTSTLSSYWDFGDSTHYEEGSSPYDSTYHFSHTYKAGRYQFMLIINGANGCADTLTSTSGVSVIAPPEASFFWDTLIPSAVNPWAEFTNTSIPLDSTCSFLWLFEKQPGDAENLDSSIETNPVYHWEVDNPLEEPQYYRVWLIETQLNQGVTGNTIACTDTLMDTVKIVPDILKFPNLVTPNGDGVNEVFRITNLIEYQRYPNNKLTIYNRWGTAIYHLDNIHSDEQFWDPNDTHSPAGTYFFRFTGQGNDGAVQRTGVIEVLRD